MQTTETTILDGVRRAGSILPVAAAVLATEGALAAIVAGALGVVLARRAPLWAGVVVAAATTAALRALGGP